MSSTDLFGPIIGPYTLEQAAVTHLQKWLWPTYLEATERANGIPVATVEKPDPSAIYGVFDDEDFISERFPGVMVSCVAPNGEPEHFSGGYIQQYELQLWCPVRNDDTFTARRNAGLYAQACMAAIVEQFAGAYPDLVSDVWMTAAPSVLLPKPDLRTVYLGHVAFNVTVGPIVEDNNGPLAPIAPEATPGKWPVVLTETLTITVEPISDLPPLPPPFVPPPRPGPLETSVTLLTSTILESSG